MKPVVVTDLNVLLKGGLFLALDLEVDEARRVWLVQVEVDVASDELSAEVEGLLGLDVERAVRGAGVLFGISLAHFIY